MIDLIDAVLLVAGLLGYEPGLFPRDDVTLALWRYRDDDEKKIFRDAMDFLRHDLPLGKVEGICAGPFGPRQITLEEWRRGYWFDFHKSAMVAPRLKSPAIFPTLRHVHVCGLTLAKRVPKPATTAKEETTCFRWLVKQRRDPAALPPTKAQVQRQFGLGPRPMRRVWERAADEVPNKRGERGGREGNKNAAAKRK